MFSSEILQQNFCKIFITKKRYPSAIANEYLFKKSQYLLSFSIHCRIRRCNLRCRRICSCPWCVRSCSRCVSSCPWSSCLCLRTIIPNDNHIIRCMGEAQFCLSICANLASLITLFLQSWQIPLLYPQNYMVHTHHMLMVY